MKKEVIMPKMGLDMTEGTVVKWHKKVGDRVEKDELLLEIETGKAITNVESAVSGTLAEIVVPEDEEVEVGTIIAWIETD
ncbi:MAG: glutaconyl-CoA/methylmalonyl-CoA decarboxylase subunit gamma [Verrucomicrobiota bacterium]|jgi:pyruvate/2-oxoglutarate dehydrogenase complex dihydrolipoamide acyltransferase (E2) component|nr:glutaconyl-CoA/methylmalonyl-CoA decarboxylase subunit gamma [Verrucomicrobiota bacterium]MDK2963817.1 glutaconyl-CoA/methylmalonyl-CoA decarboxylase subunit gamma [Verrucomicrobiota bacterium]